MPQHKFWVGFASTPEEMERIYRLRYNDMILEYRSDNTNAEQRDVNEYDGYARHLIVKEEDTGEVVGYYRMIESDSLTDGRRFVCEEEYDLDELKRRGDKICEFSRAVVKKEYRGGAVMLLLWKFILRYMQDNGVRYLVGDASFFGTDRDRYAKEISYMVHNYVVDEDLRIRSRDTLGPMTLPEPSEYDEKEVFAALPPLFKAYLTLGARVSAQPFVDTVFGSVDMFVIVDMQHCNGPFVEKLLRH